MGEKRYPSNISEGGWEEVKDLLPAAKPGGRPRTTSLKAILNACFFIVKTGCQWRYLPSDFPNWSTVYTYYRNWKNDGTWQLIHDTLRARLRRKHGRHKHPTAACIDSQSVKITVAGGVKGFDAGKLVKGRKRHILVDTMGLLLAVIVTGANVQDRDGAKLLFKNMGGCCKKLRKIWADSVYNGSLLEWVEKHCQFQLSQVLRPKGSKGFVLLPRRWVVERTFAWFDLHRRLSKDYENQTESSEAVIHIAMIRLMLNRLN